MSKTKTPQQETPFILEGNTAPRSQVRALKETITEADGLFKVSLGIIRIRPGLNARRKHAGMYEELYEQLLMIPELADGIFISNGPAEPLLGDIYKEDGCFYLTNGERRFRALRHLVATNRLVYPNGEPVTTVKVMVNAANTTDKDRKRKVITTQDNLKLKPMERAFYYLSFQEEDGMNHEEIAEFLGISRATVDNYIMACQLPQEVQDKLDSGEINITEALAEYRKANPKRKSKQAVVDTDSGEILSEYQEDKIDAEQKEKDKLRGDEDDFLEQDNTKTFPGSKGGPSEGGSNAVVIGKDSIYMDSQKLALWKQFVNRYEKLKTDIIDGNRSVKAWEDELAEQLKNEYNLTVK